MGFLLRGRRRGEEAQQQPPPQQQPTVHHHYILPETARLLLEDDRRVQEGIVGRYPFVATSPEVKLANVENGFMLTGIWLGHLGAMLELKALGWRDHLRVPPMLADNLVYTAVSKSIRGRMLTMLGGVR